MHLFILISICLFSFLHCTNNLHNIYSTPINRLPDDDLEESTDPLESQIGSMQSFYQRSFYMGTADSHYERKGEHPIRREYTHDFMLDRYPVTNVDFSNFVKERAYYTTQPDLNKFSYVFHNHFVRQVNSIIYQEKYQTKEPWMMPIVGTRWDKPYGSKPIGLSNLALRPVVHVGLADADAYCRHLGKRLPNEYEWELAVRGNNHSWDYPWGFGMRRNRMNIWQGIFPLHDHGYDGYSEVSPVNAYPSQNQWGMYDMLGNIWEWTTTNYRGEDLPRNSGPANQWYTVKGGSYLDSILPEDDDYSKIPTNTLPVRCSIKQARHYTYTAGNLGFRCAKTINSTLTPSRAADKKTPRLIRYNETHAYKMRVDALAKRFIILKHKMQRTNKTQTTLEGHRHYFQNKQNKNKKDEL